MSIVRLVARRSRHHTRNAAWQQRQFYLHVYPRTTHYEIEDDPNVAIRKFTPCGRFVVTFSRAPDVHRVDVCVLLPLLSSHQSCASSFPAVVFRMDNVSYRLRTGYRHTDKCPQALWKHFFQLHFSCQVCRGEDVALNKDFCLFTPDARYLLVASTKSIDEPLEEEDDVISAVRTVEDITIHVIDMETGTVCCEHKFEADSISLAHNAGIHLRGSMLAVFSTYRQTIHLFTIRDTGQLHKLQMIGSSCYPDDAMYLAQTRAPAPMLRVPAPPLAPPTSLSAILEPPAPMPQIIEVESPDHCIGGIKHRLLAFLWRRAKTSSVGQKAKLRYFHNHFEEYRALCIWKMQLLDDHHLLLKFGSVKYVESKSSDSMGILAFFVVYNFLTTEIVNVYENNSQELLQAYESCTEFFFEDRVAVAPGQAGLTGLLQLTLPSNSQNAREMFRKQLYAARTARNGGQDQSIRRNLSELPVAPQHYRESPYFDLELFSCGPVLGIAGDCSF